MNQSFDSMLSKKKLAVAMIAICLAASAPINDLIVIPAAESMFMAFPENPGAVNFILSGPSLLAVFSALVTGRALMYFNKKTWLLCGFALFGVASICGVLISSPTYMVIMRSIVGWSIGMITPTAIALIAELFTNETLRGTMMGIFNSVMAAFGVVFSATAGNVVANISWEAVFRIYWFTVPVFVILFLALPSFPAERDKPKDKTITKGDERIPWSAFIINTLGVFAIILITDVMYYMSSVYVAETNLGTAAFAGLLGSCITIGSVVGCLVFGPLYARGKNVMPTAMFLVMAGAYFILGYWISIPSVMAASVIIGFLIGMGETYYQTNITVVVSPKYVSMGIGLVMAGLGLGMFLATYTYTLLANIVPSGSSAGVMKSLAYISLICTAIALIICIKRIKTAKVDQTMEA